MSYELPSNTNLTWRLGGASQASASTSAAAAKGVQTETLYAAVDNRTDKMTTEMQAKTAGTHLEPQQLSGGLRGDPTGFSYAITLAVLALLGLVSVARRDVNKPKS